MQLYDSSCFFFSNDTAPTEIYTLSLHDALPISFVPKRTLNVSWLPLVPFMPSSTFPSQGSQKEYQKLSGPRTDRKSTRLNSSHSSISYAVFCLKKKKKQKDKLWKCQQIKQHIAI